MEIGTLLRKLRDSNNLSSRAFAEKIGVSHSTYMDWEHEKSTLSFKNYVRIANALNIDPVSLMAFFTGKTDQVKSKIEEGNASELWEVVKHYRKYTEQLEMEKSSLEIQIAELKSKLIN